MSCRCDCMLETESVCMRDGRSRVGKTCECESVQENRIRE